MSAATADFTFTVDNRVDFSTYYVREGSDLVVVEEHDGKGNVDIRRYTTVATAREMFAIALDLGDLVLDPSLGLNA